MASRESQGLQIALILFVMVTVVLAVTTYVYFRKAEDKIRQAAAARVEAKNAQDALMQLQFEVQLLKYVLGYETKSETEVETIVQSLGETSEAKKMLDGFRRDMASYASGLQDTSPNYRTLPKQLVDEIGKVKQQLAEAGERENALIQARDQAVQAEKARTAKAVDELTKTKQELDAERKKFNAERGRITADNARLAAEKKPLQAEIARLTATMATEIETREKALSQVSQLYQIARDKLEKQKEPTFEHPDGKVVMVNMGANLVWIDLGSADGVQRMMTFSVVDQNETGVGTAPVKARIEVTQVKDIHLAEARILEDQLGEPIMEGDQIYSPSFRRGEKTHFALAGFMDLNSDGKSDQSKVKSIITINNGVVDSEMLEDGSIAGKITVDTDYLVKGEAPTDRTNERLTQGYSKMIEEATKWGVKTITLAALLDRMGYRDERRVVDLRQGGTGGSGSTGGPGAAPKFRRRSPVSAY